MSTVKITPWGGGSPQASTDQMTYTAAQPEPATMDHPCGCQGGMVTENDIAAALRRYRTIQVLEILFWVLFIIVLIRLLFR